MTDHNHDGLSSYIMERFRKLAILKATFRSDSNFFDLRRLNKARSMNVKYNVDTGIEIGIEFTKNPCMHANTL